MSHVVEPGTSSDLAGILDWLKSEYEADGYGFWENRNMIRNAFESEDLSIIREHGKPVAFQVGNHSLNIVCVRKGRQRAGHGTALFKATLARAYHDDVNVLRVKCSPLSSRPFWRKHGFVGRNPESTNLRRILQRSHDVPAALPRVSAEISFYNEAASYSTQAPRKVENLLGALHPDGTIQLSRRVICPTEETGGIPFVTISVDGQEVLRGDALDEAAASAGVRHDRDGDNFWLDEVRLR